MKPIKREFARYLRVEQTASEKVVWKLLRNRKFRGIKFRRQHVIEGFVVDFFCHELRLAIEIDGKVHEKQKEYDEIRQEMLESKSISLIRIKNDEITRDENIVFKKIDKFLNYMAASPLPLGEGLGVRV